MWGTTRARSKSNRRAAPALPEDLIAWEILTRLPAKALLRCRGVCRSWRLLTSDADFLVAHHRRQPSLPLVVFHSQIGDHRGVVSARLDVLDLRAAPAAAERRRILGLNDTGERRGFNVRASCDGLLVFSPYNRCFRICNPATRQCKALTGLSGIGTTVVALYLHSSSGEYRILFSKLSCSDLNFAYYVLTVGSYAKPRCIGLPTDAVVSASMKQRIPSILLHSCLHWIVYSLPESSLLVFDTVAESFRCMRPPTTETDQNGQWQHLLEMDGTLGISHIDESKMMVKIWVLQDYEMEVWSLKYRIQLPMKELSVGMNCSFQVRPVRAVLGNGDVLVSCSDLCHLFYCDSKGKLLQKFRWHDVLSGPIGHWFKESLVRHAFFEGRNNDCVFGQPSFFEEPKCPWFSRVHLS